ncbi:hypothetical protein Celaphus_00017736, partial [Cervus elaphus hippelaphus]
MILPPSVNVTDLFIVDHVYVVGIAPCTDCPVFSLFLPGGLEHHLSQLADLHAAHLVLHSVVIRNWRKYAMISSSFMVVYGNLLLIPRYMWSFELPEIKKVPEILRNEGAGGARLKDDEQDVQVDSKAQEKEEEKEPKEEQQEQREEEEEEEVDEQDVMKVLGNLVVALFIKYLIYICRGMFFFISFEGKIMMYKIIHMVLCLFYVALYQVHYEWWRRILKYFWKSVVIYMMLVLIFIYTYQFENFPGLWQNMTGLKKRKLSNCSGQQGG